MAEASASASLLTETADQQQPAAAVASPESKQQHSTRSHAVANDSKVLKLKGLPYSTSENDIHTFFSGFTLTDVAFVYEPDGRPSGLAFAEFATREEALQALSKNGEYLGDRYVRLLHVPKQEMEEQVRLGTLAIPGAQAKMRQRMLRGAGGGLPNGAYSDAMQQMPGGMLQGGQQVVQDLTGAAAGFQLPALMPAGMGHPGMGQQGMLPGMNLGPMGHSGAMGGHSMLPGGMGAAEQHMQLPMGNQQGLGGMAGMPPHMALAYQLSGMGIGGGGRPSSNPMMGMLPHGFPAAAAQPAPHMAVIGTDSKTIKIRGLPFRATPLDIFNFFDGYEVIQESLQLGVDSLGRPSGEAWLTFTSADEALRAVRERNRHYLGNRYLELSLT